jgi:glycyl-tRNA synthetase beta chain
MEDLSVAYTRAKNLAKEDLGVEADRALMGSEEVALADALESAEKTAGALMGEHAYSVALESLAGLRTPIDAFFEGVLVMDSDERLRDNRLRLLNRFVGVFGGFADFSKLAG